MTLRARTAHVRRQGPRVVALPRGGPTPPGLPLPVDEPVLDGGPLGPMEAGEGTRIEKAGAEQGPIDIPTSAVQTLKRLQALPLGGTGIGDEEPVSLQAEMMRWAMLMQRAPEELTTRARELGGLLAQHVPTEHAPTLVHGDLHYGNMLFRGADVVAVLDWEIAEIGQPLLDLGSLCIVSVRRHYRDATNPDGAIDVPVEELYRLYGTDADEMRWYLALSIYKYASIYGYNLMLHRRGNRTDPMYEGLTDTIKGMIDDGIAVFEGHH